MSLLKSTPRWMMIRLAVVMVALMGVAGLAGAPVLAQGTQPANEPAAPPASTPAEPPAVSSPSTGSTPASSTDATAAPVVDATTVPPPAPAPTTTPTAEPAEASSPNSSTAAPETSSTTAPAESTGAPDAASTDAALTQAISAYEKQDFATAADALKHAIDADPASVKAHYYLGYALYKLKRFDESKVAFTQAYRLQSDYLPPVAAAK